MNTEKNQRLVLLAANISYILVLLDSSIVNVALPAIRNGLAIGTDTLQWMVNVYLVIFASLLLSGGALCDRLSAKTVYMAGLLLFVAASLLCGLSASAAQLLAGRACQGIGAALLVPSSLALITHTYTESSARAKAIASWASWGGDRPGNGTIDRRAPDSIPVMALDLSGQHSRRPAWRLADLSNRDPDSAP